jgi:uncharacterized damage-inducible protein DinB
MTELTTTEVRDLLQTLAKHRGLLRVTVHGLTEEQARLRPTASELSLGGLIRHVGTVEQQWARFIEGGAAAMEDPELDWMAEFRMRDDDTLAALLERYDKIAARTDALIATTDLDLSHLLPVQPWHQPGSAWSVRRVALHVIAETAQHAGHADILRETIDGQRSMG